MPLTLVNILPIQCIITIMIGTVRVIFPQADVFQLGIVTMILILIIWVVDMDALLM
jgi:hypothetical protein